MGRDVCMLPGCWADCGRIATVSQMAAIRQYEASVAEGSEASGALSDSTGVSPASLHGLQTAPSVHTSSGATATPWAPRSDSGGALHIGVGAFRSSPPGDGLDSGGHADGSCSGFEHWTPPPHSPPARFQHQHSAFSAAPPFGSGGVGSFHQQRGQLRGSASLDARSGGSGWGSPQEEGPVDLVECLLCGLATCPAKGPQCIRCACRSPPAPLPPLWCSRDGLGLLVASSSLDAVNSWGRQLGQRQDRQRWRFISSPT